MVNTNIAELVASRIYATKKHNVRYDEVLTYVLRLFQYIDEFNTLEEDETWCLNRTIDTIDVPSDFKDFIIPNTIRLRDDRRYPDLLQRGSKSYFGTLVKVKKFSTEDETDHEKKKFLIQREKVLSAPLSYADYSITLAWLYNYIHASMSVTKLSNIKQNVLLMDVIDRVPVGGKLNYTGNPCIPVNIDVNVRKVIGDVIPNTSCQQIVLDYVSQMWRE